MFGQPHSTESDELTLNLQAELQRVHPPLVLQKRTRLILPDRDIFAGSVGLPAEKRIIDSRTQEILHSSKKIVELCDIDVNTSLSELLKLRNENQEYMPMIMELFTHLARRIKHIIPPRI